MKKKTKPIKKIKELKSKKDQKFLNRFKKRVEEAKKTKKTTKKDKNVNVKENTATPILPTTTYYIKSWGYYNKNKNIIIEQITPNIFIFNNNGIIGLVETEEALDWVGNKQVVVGKKIIIDGIEYRFGKRIYKAYHYYNVPSIRKCEDFIKGKFKPRDYREIQKDIKKVLSAMFDFSNETDIEVSNISISQSWIKPLLDNFFFYGIDATKGGGKTTLGEIVYFLMRHGFVGGNISSPALVRLTNELDLNIFIDEIDQNRNDDDLMSVLRKGQRRGNPYVRCEGRDNHPVAYDIAGCHGFSFRSEIEDAFGDRSLRVHTTKSMDSMLPIINTYKQEVLRELADELFLSFIANIHVVGSSRKKGCSRVFNTYNISRKNIYNVLTSDLNTDEKSYLTKVFGRDNELSYLCLQTSKILGLNMIESIKKIIEKKKQDVEISGSFYLEELKEFVYKEHKKLFTKILKEGNHAGFYFYPKNRLYAEYIKHLKEMNVLSIGTKKFSSMLRDLGFVEGDNLTSQRFENNPQPCLVFNPPILDKMSLPYPAKLKLGLIQEEFLE